MDPSPAQALDVLRQSHEAGRLAHAYIVEGSPEETCRFAEALATYLLTEELSAPRERESAALRITHRAHPDVHWHRPESKSRQIPIAVVRELNRAMAHSSMEGGWKIGVVVQADRLTSQAQNAFLKTLEEPPARSLLLLLTDAPQSLYTTIVSRCQRVVLAREATGRESAWATRTLALLAAERGQEVLDEMAGAAQWKGLLDEIAAEVEAEEAEAQADPDEDEKKYQARIEARIREARTEMLAVTQKWRRDLLFMALGLPEELLHFPAQAELLRRRADGLSPAAALQATAAVEDMVRQFDRHLPDLAVFEHDALQAVAARQGL